MWHRNRFLTWSPHWFMLPSRACSHAVNMTDTQWVHSFHVELIISVWFSVWSHSCLRVEVLTSFSRIWITSAARAGMKVSPWVPTWAFVRSCLTGSWFETSTCWLRGLQQRLLGCQWNPKKSEHQQKNWSWFWFCWKVTCSMLSSLYGSSSITSLFCPPATSSWAFTNMETVDSKFDVLEDRHLFDIWKWLRLHTSSSKSSWYWSSTVSSCWSGFPAI